MIRFKANYDVNNHGESQCWVPRGSFSMAESSRSLSELEDGQFKKQHEFTQYVTALAGIPQEGKTGLAHFENTEKVFFERCCFVRNNHVANKWRSSKTLNYMLAGGKHHTHKFAKWIVDYKRSIPAEG